LTNGNTSYIHRIDACFDLNRPILDPSKGRAYFAMGSNDQDFNSLSLIRNYVTRCIRGVPYNEWLLLNPGSSASDYFNESLNTTRELLNHYKQQLFEIKGGLDEMPKVSRIDNGDVQPYYLKGRGNFWFTTIHQLEHTVEQIMYLVDKDLLPTEFTTFAMHIKYKIVPKIANALQPQCVYFAKSDRSVGCPADVRMRYYMLDPWMIEEMYGLHNKLVYSAVEAPAVFGFAHALNPDLDFEGIQDAYFRGDVLQIDNLLTETALREIRKVALESTTFYDSKVGYLGSYMDDGLSSTWIRKLGRELQERLPRVLKDQPLRQAWFYKYDSEDEDNYQRGIKVHADLARVNLNIWLTPDEANLDKESGGLLIYDALPGGEEDFGFENFADWNNWENVEDMMKYLKDSNAKVTKVTNKQNRCAMFNSALLHETDKFKFKDGYLNRRINLTLLFGLDTVVDGKPTGVLTKFE